MSSYSDVVGQASMLFDHVRNAAYERAILSRVTAESVVLDLGAGLGLHGLMAAKAGARKVYLVDPSSAIFAAEKVAKANGFDNVVCIQSRAEDLELDEKVDLIISVFTGNFLLTEDLLPSLFFARDKFLKDGGHLIPERAQMMVAPVSMQKYHGSYISRWNDQAENSLHQKFGIDYSVIKQYADNSLYYDDFSVVDFVEIAPVKSLTEIDFHSANKAESFDVVTLEAEISETMHGWLGWFDMFLGDEWLSTSPKSDKLHWSQVFLPFPGQIAIESGDTLSFELKRPEYGDWTWLSTPGSEKSQSTFLARPVKAEDILKQAPNYKPKLSEDGEILRFLFDCFDGHNSTEEIVAKLVTAFPKKFPNDEKALNYVKLQVNIFS